jgi:hypothetical protein
VVSASKGIVDAIDRDSVVVVPCNDPVALRTAVMQLIDRPREAALLAQRARDEVLRDRTLAKWVSRIVASCAEAEGGKQPKRAEP